MDTMLDALEGREDVLPDLWISELEEVEECFGAWEMDGERVVLEGRLRLDDLRHHQTRREELEREREKTVLVLEQERSVREAEQVGVEVDGVMERAEETERGLREAIEANEVVAEGIELGDDIEGAGSPVEGYGSEWVGRELLMKLESVEKMRMGRSWSIGSEAETEAEWVDANEERVRISRGGSIADASGVRRHGLSLDPIHIEKRWSGISTGSTPYMTPMPTSWFVQNGYVPENHGFRGSGSLLYPSDIAPARNYPIQHPVAGQMHPTTTQLHPDVTQAHPATTQTHPSTTQTHPSTMQTHPSTTQTHPSTTQTHPAVVQNHPAVTQTHPSVTQIHPATVQTHPSVTQSHPAVAQIHPSTIQIHPSVIQNHPAVTQIHPSTTQLHPATQIPAAPPQTPPPRAQKERSASSSPKIIKELPNILAAARSFFKVEKRLEVERELDRESGKVLAAQIKAEEKERRNYEEEEIDRLAELEAAKFFEECERAADAEVEEEEGQWADEEEREQVREEEEEEERNMVWRAAAEHGLWATAGESQREKIAKRQKAAAVEAEVEREEAIKEAEFRQRIATGEAGVTEEADAEHQEEAERKRRASLERVFSLEAARLSTEAEHQRLLAEEAAFIVAEERQRLGKEREAHSERILANQEEEAAERTRLAATAATATAVSVAAAEVERRRHRHKEGGFAAAEIKRIETEAGHQRLAEEAKRQREAEASRLAAVKVEAEADQQRRRLEVERLAALEAVRLADKAERERQKLVDEEAERQRVAATAAAAIEAERQRLVEEKAALVSAAQQAALVEAAEAEEKKRAAEAEVERKRLIEEEAEKQRGLEIERLAAIKAENQRIATLKAERQRTIEEESRRNAEAQAEATRRAEQEAARKQEELERSAIEAAHVAEEEAEQLRVVKEEAERLRLVEVERLATLEAARVVAEEEAERQRVADQQKAETERLAALAVKEAELQEILEQQARLDSEAELKSRQNLALAERERQLLAIQEAERLKMEREIEEARIKAEIVKEEDERRRQKSLLAAEKHTGSNSEGGSTSGDDVAEKYSDVTRVGKPLPLKDSDEDSEGDRIRLSKSHTSQPSVPPPSAEMTPVTSRSSSAQGAPEWSPESPKITLASAKATQEVSDGSSDFDSEVDLIAAENRAAHDSLQKALSGEPDLPPPADEVLTSPKDSAERELPRAIRSPDRSIPEISLTGVSSVFVAPLTPQNPSGFGELEHTPGAAVWNHSVNSPVFDDVDSFEDGFPFDANIDENRYQELENYGAEDDSSDFDVIPIANSTPKPARRLGRLSGLDSITEVLTPHTPHEQYFKASDGSRLDDDDTPSKRGKRGDLALPDGFSRDGEDSDGSPRGYSNDTQQWGPIPLDMSSARPRSSMSNKVCLPILVVSEFANFNKSSMSNLSTKIRPTPETKPSIKTQRSQRFTRKAPLDMSRPRSLSSTGDRPRPLSAASDYYISPGLTTSKLLPKAMQKGPPRALSGERPRPPSAANDYYTPPGSKVPPKAIIRGPPRVPSGERPRPASSTSDYVPPGSTNLKVLPKAVLKGAPKGALGPAMKAIRRSRKDIDSDDESVAGEPRWPRSQENTPDWAPSPPAPIPGPAPRLNVAKHSRQPSNFANQVTPDRNRRLYQSGISYNQEGSSLVPKPPKLEFPQQSLDDKVNGILAALASPVRLTASNLQKLSETTNKRQLPLRPFDAPSNIPAPRSIGSNPSVISDATSFSRGGRRHVPSTPGDIKLYHLHRTDGQAPIKLYIRLVGEKGERVMVRVGGGWADLAEYLKEYATHHGSKRRVVSEGRIEIQDFGAAAQHHSLHPARSVSSLRTASPAPGSRPGSPHTGNRSRSASAMGFNCRAESPFSRRAESPSPASPHRVAMRGGHNGTTKDLPITPTLTMFQPLTYQRPSGLSPPTGSRPSSRPGSSHSTAGVIRRSASRLSFSSAFDSGEMGGLIDPGPPKPLGLAGPKGKNNEISPENQAWVEGMLGEVQKVSAGRRRRLTGGSNNGDMDFNPGEIMELQAGTGGQQFGGRLGISDMGKQGGTRRVFPRQG